MIGRGPISSMADPRAQVKPPREQYEYPADRSRQRLRITQEEAFRNKFTWRLEHLAPNGSVIWKVRLGEVMGQLVLDAMRRARNPGQPSYAETGDEPRLTDLQLGIISEALSADPLDFLYRSLKGGGVVVMKEREFAACLQEAARRGDAT